MGAHARPSRVALGMGVPTEECVRRSNLGLVLHLWGEMGYGKQRLEFEDEEYASGQIRLQGEADGVLYRNLKVTETK